ncbi:MAG: response regulator [Candidatus Binatia bacterium]
MSRMVATDTEACVKPAPLTVIIAEKHPLARAAFATLLSYDGCRVFQADSPKAAISLIDSVGSVAVLLADLDMPEWSLIVQHAVQNTDALIIAMEEHQAISKLHDLKACGIRLCLQKPINYGDLQTAIWKELGLRHAPKLALNKRSSANQQQRTAIG